MSEPKTYTLYVTERLTYEFSVPESMKDATNEELDDYFCSMSNPVEEAMAFAVNERSCEVEADE